jgi:hypothetical protein
MANNATPSLVELSTSVSNVPEGVSTITAMIAETQPSVLRSAINQAIFNSLEAKMHKDAGTNLVVSAENRYEQAFKDSSPRLSRNATRVFLEKTISEQREAEDKYANLLPQLELALLVSTTRDKLSKRARWLSAIACTMTLGVGTSALVYTAENESNHVAAQIAEQNNKNAPKGEKLEVPSTRFTEGDAIAVDFSGAGGGVAGLAAGLYVGELVAGRSARRRARRIISKA